MLQVETGWWGRHQGSWPLGPGIAVSQGVCEEAPAWQGSSAEGCAVRDAAGNRGQWGHLTGRSSRGGSSAQDLEKELHGEGKGTASLSQPHFGGPRDDHSPSLLPPAGASCWPNPKGATVHRVSWPSRMRRAGASGRAKGGPTQCQSQAALHPVHWWASFPCVPLFWAGVMANSSSSAWLRGKSNTCRAVTCSGAMRGHCSCSITGTSSLCGGPWPACGRSFRLQLDCFRWAPSPGLEAPAEARRCLSPGCFTGTYKSLVKTSREERNSGG